MGVTRLMAYADRKMSSNRIVALVIVALIHALLGYAFITGLAYKAIKQANKDLNVFDVTEEPPPPEELPPPPPPPPDQVQPAAPPVVVPTARYPVPTPNRVESTPTIPPSSPMVPQPLPPSPTPAPVPVPVPAPVPVPVPAPAPVKVTAAKAKATLGSLVTQGDYPEAAAERGESGTTGFTLNVGTDGSVTGCRVTSSSGSSTLDRATCNIMKRKARFTPAVDSDGKPTTDTHNNRIKWVLKEE